MSSAPRIYTRDAGIEQLEKSADHAVDHTGDQLEAEGAFSLLLAEHADLRQLAAEHFVRAALRRRSNVRAALRHRPWNRIFVEAGGVK
jgi:hypothetical protein